MHFETDALRYGTAWASKRVKNNLHETPACYRKRFCTIALDFIATI